MKTWNSIVHYKSAVSDAKMQLIKLSIEWVPQSVKKTPI